MKQRRLLFIVLTLLVLVFGFFGLLIFGFLNFDSEQQDWKTLQQIVADHDQLAKYKQENGVYPDNLAQAGVNNKKCFLWQCFDLAYKVSTDKKSYKMASKVNGPFVVYYNPSYEDGEKLPDGGATYGIALEEGYSGDRVDWPIYRNDLKEFSNPELWPELK